jgi:hypothetical protein
MSDYLNEDDEISHSLKLQEEQEYNSFYGGNNENDFNNGEEDGDELMRENEYLNHEEENIQNQNEDGDKGKKHILQFLLFVFH